MATANYNLPTINGTDTIDGVNAINGLANAVDAALRNVATSVPNVTELTQEINSVKTIAEDAQVAADGVASTAQAAQNTANAAQSTANTAQTTATTANTNATNALQKWNASPVDVLQSTVSSYVTGNSFTAEAWGNIVVVSFDSISNIQQDAKLKVGQLKSGYYPASTKTVLTAVYEPVKQYVYNCFLQVDTSGGLYIHLVIPAGTSMMGAVEPRGQVVFCANTPI